MSSNRRQFIAGMGASGAAAVGGCANADSTGVEARAIADLPADKTKHTIYERAKVAEAAVAQLRELVRDKPLDVLGHLESAAYCCRAGTVAIVEVDIDKINPSSK